MAPPNTDAPPLLRVCHRWHRRQACNLVSRVTAHAALSGLSDTSNRSSLTSDCIPGRKGWKTWSFSDNRANAMEGRDENSSDSPHHLAGSNRVH